MRKAVGSIPGFQFAVWEIDDHPETTSAPQVCTSVKKTAKRSSGADRCVLGTFNQSHKES